MSVMRNKDDVASLRTIAQSVTQDLADTSAEPASSVEIYLILVLEQTRQMFARVAMIQYQGGEPDYSMLQPASFHLG